LHYQCSYHLLQKEREHFLFHIFLFHIQEKSHEKCLVGLNAITKEAWNTAQQTEDKREWIQALSLAKNCYSMKLELLTSATVVDDAMRFVEEKSHLSTNNSGVNQITNNKQRQEEYELTNNVF
jgi:hypothetical protein